MAITETATGNGSTAVTAIATGKTSKGVAATSNGEESVALVATANGQGSDAIQANGADVGIRARGTTWHGIAAISDSTVGGVAVLGEGWGTGEAVRGVSKQSHGVHGVSEGPNGWGVFGEGVNSGVVGYSKTWVGVYGETAGVANGPAGVWGEHKGAGIGVKAVSQDGIGLAAYSTGHEAVHAETRSAETAAIAAYNLNPASTGAALFAKKEGSQGHAGFFDGNVWVSGEVAVGKDILLANADCAEDFDIAEADLVEPGAVMVVGEDGVLEQSRQAYDKRVAGVLSGAGAYRPGIVLDKQHARLDRKPLALLGKVYCKVDASQAPIEVGDLLTTAPTPGHAMKATDPLRAFGAVLGKALRPLKEGCGLIPILVALQ
jgi:hypothetical protein